MKAMHNTPEPHPYSDLPPQSPDEPRPRLLVVDDSTTDRLTVAKFCDGLDCEVDVAASGDEAIENFKTTRYALVVVDYHMEPINGLQLISILREIDESAEYLIMTGYPDSKVMAYVQNNDMPPVMTKPITPGTLLTHAIVGLEKMRGSVVPQHSIGLSHRMDECVTLLGCSTALTRLRREVMAHLSVREPLVVAGEPESGKAPLARLLHQAGPYGRSLGIECFCLNESEEHIERTLISREARPGSLFKMARNQTLILHNLESIPLHLQSALLQRLDELSGTSHLIVVVDGELDELLDKETVHPELFFQLFKNVLEVPPLRERMEDLPEIARAIAADPRTYGLKRQVEEDEVRLCLDSLETASAQVDFQVLIDRLRSAAERPHA